MDKKWKDNEVRCPSCNEIIEDEAWIKTIPNYPQTAFYRYSLLEFTCPKCRVKEFMTKIDEKVLWHYDRWMNFFFTNKFKCPFCEHIDIHEYVSGYHRGYLRCTKYSELSVIPHSS